MSVHDDAEELERTSDRIERLLGDLRASTSPAAWAKIEELVASLTAIYGRGLAQMLEAFAGGGAIGDEVRARLCDDPLVESLLLLHGLHPAPLEERVARAVERVRAAIGHASGELRASIEGADVSVYIAGDWRRCPVPPAAIESALRRAIEEAAPEIARVAIEVDAAVASAWPAKSENLVQIDLARSRSASIETRSIETRSIETRSIETRSSTTRSSEAPSGEAR